MAKSKSVREPADNLIEPVSIRVHEQTPPRHPPRENERGPTPGTRDDRAGSPQQSERGPKAQFASTSGPQSATDFQSVPQAVRERFLNVNEKYFFPNGDPAFRDHGAKLSTRSENAEVVRSLVEIAQARGWSEITVSGTTEFRRAVWHDATLAHLTVRGFTATELDEARVVRTMARAVAAQREAPTAEASGSSPAQRNSEDAISREDDGAKAARTRSRAKDGSAERTVFGTLIDHGHENFEFNPHEEMSYFVKLRMDDGSERTRWGKDLERALLRSKTQPQTGDRVGVRYLGERPVTVMKRERDAQGHVVSERPLKTHRNEWMVESEHFFQERTMLAETVRDPKVRPQAAVDTHPQLAGTYLALGGAEVVAKHRFPDKHDQERFVETVRRALAREIKRGDALMAPEMRDRSRYSEKTPPGREPARVPS
jgi:hypothetical protein